MLHKNMWHLIFMLYHHFVKALLSIKMQTFCTYHFSLCHFDAFSSFQALFFSLFSYLLKCKIKIICIFICSVFNKIFYLLLNIMRVKASELEIYKSGMRSLYFQSIYPHFHYALYDPLKYCTNFWSLHGSEVWNLCLSHKILNIGIDHSLNK